MTIKRSKSDRAYQQAKDLQKDLPMQDITPPEHLDPKYIDQIIVRGENLLAADKREVKKQKRKKRPVLYKSLAVAMSLVLALGLGSYAFKEGMQKQDIAYTHDTDSESGLHTTAKTTGNVLDGTGMMTVADYFDVANDDYSPLSLYNDKLKAAVKEAEKKTFFTTVTETVDEMMDFGMKTEDSAIAPDSAKPGMDGAESTTGIAEEGDYSDTNNQVANVQEGDIIKTNGAYILVLSATGNLVCQRVEADGSLTKTGTVSVDASVYEMFFYQNHIAVVTQEYIRDHDYRTQTTKVYLYTLDEMGGIQSAGSYMQSGNYVSGRVTDGVLYIVTNQHAFSVYSGGYEDYDDTLPLIWSEEESRSVTTGEMYITDCPSYDMSYTNITGHVFGKMPENVNTVSILGSGAGEIYCTPDHLYILSTNSYYTNLAQKKGEYVGQTTSIYSYALDGGNITAKAQGEVIGWTLNQFSADAYNGYFRIATSDNDACRVTTLDENLQLVSELKDLAEGERIYACKFMGDTAYLVTFYETDPLFVIDLSDVKAPKVLGELKIPGYSNYLYPLGGDYLVGVGMNADENGSVNGLRINLFDVSDPTNPHLSDVRILYGDGGALAGEDHKAYYADAKNGLFGFPLFTYQKGRQSFDGFVMFAAENGKLQVKNEWNFLAESSTLSWDKEYLLSYAYNGYYIKRAIYVNDTLYLLSNDHLYAYGRSDFAYLNQFDLD